jgi:hypothetical protein
MLERWRLVLQLASGSLDGAKMSWSDGGAKTPTALAKDWCGRLLGRRPSKRTLDEATAFLAQGRNPDYEMPEQALKERTAPALALILMSPDFQWR